MRVLSKDLLDHEDLPEAEELSVEEYSQIDPDAFAVFPDNSLPLDLYHFIEDSNLLSKVHRAGQSLSMHNRAEYGVLAQEGLLFYCRDQQDAYVACLARGDLGAILDDPNLSPEQISQLLVERLHELQKAVLAQPMRNEAKALEQALEVLSLFLCLDKRNKDHVLSQVHRNLARERQKLNSALIAVTIYTLVHQGKIIVETLGQAAMGFFLYDIGMSTISELVTGQSRQLSTDEQRRMRKHPHAGESLIRRMGYGSRLVLEPSLQHHERLDGTGYPERLKGEQIGLLGRISAIADSYSAIITDRPHSKKKAPLKAAIELLQMGTVYDSRICKLFVRYLQGISY